MDRLVEALTDRVGGDGKDGSRGDERVRDAREGRYDGLTLYLREVGKLGRLTREDEVALTERIRAGDAVAREQMIEGNLRLVVLVARRYTSSGLPLLDLIAEGNIGLVRAVERYDVRQGCRFATYAVWWIRNMILRGLAGQARVVRIPPHQVESFHRLTRTQWRLRQELEREPTLDELAEAIEMPVPKVEALCRLTRPAVSLSAARHDDANATLADDLVDDRTPTPWEGAGEVVLRRQLSAAMGSLNEMERKVLVMRFGFDDGQERSRAEIGRQFGVTREAIRQIEIRALKRLRHPVRLGVLRGSLERA